MQKQWKILGSTTILFLGFFLAISAGLWHGNSEQALAEENAPSTLYFPMMLCKECAGAELLQPSLTATYAVTVTDGVPYGAAGLISGTGSITIPLLADVYEPTNAPAGKRPVIIWMPGSGFVDLNASRKGRFVPIAQQLAARGYVVVAIDYRTSFLNPIVSAQAQPYLTQVVTPSDNSWVPFVFINPPLTEEQYERGIAAAYDDGLTALKWVAAQATLLNIDTNRITMMGSSAGTITIDNLAYVSDDIGVTTPKIATVLHLWGGLQFTRDDGLSEMEIDEAPIFMVHSINDLGANAGTDYIMSKEMADRAAAIGLPHEFITLLPDPNGITDALKAGTGHGLTQVPILEVISDDGQTLFQRMVNFLNNALDERKLDPSLAATYAVTVTDGVPYGAAGLISGTGSITIPLLADVYEPTNAPAGKRPVIIWMPGSGFVDLNASRKGRFVPIAQQLAARGYVVVAIDYRTSFLNPIVSAQAQPYLTQVVTPSDNSWVPFVFINPPLTEEQYERGIAAAYDDGLTALKWVAAHAMTLNIDMERVTMMGSSAGTITIDNLAYVSDEIGVTTPKIATVLHLWGGLQFTRDDGLSEMEIDEAPIFMVHSINDLGANAGVDYIMSKEMADRAEAIGLPYEFITLLPDPNGITDALKAGSGHGLTQVPILEVIADDGQTLFQRMVNFLDSKLP